MQHVTFRPSSLVCSKSINFDLDENRHIHNLEFIGGCSGNLKAISKLCENQPASHIIELLKGNNCGLRQTSCADQLAKALEEAINSVL